MEFFSGRVVRDAVHVPFEFEGGGGHGHLAA